jgi:putative transposase
MFVEMLRYKLQWAGKLFVTIDRYFASSKTCSCCGAVKDEIPLQIRTFECEACGLVLDRDLNAAVNIRRQGMSQLLVEGLSGSGPGEARIPAL